MATNATTEAIVVNALARAQEYNTIRPVARSVLYRRISIRQQELAIAAARVNRDYYGVAANAVVIGGAIDVNDITSPVQWPEFIDKITVGAVGVGATRGGGCGSLDRAARRRGGRGAAARHDALGRDPPSRHRPRERVTSLKVYYSKIPDSLPLERERHVARRDPRAVRRAARARRRALPRRRAASPARRTTRRR
jgi:hypothetical protein